MLHFYNIHLPDGLRQQFGGRASWGASAVENPSPEIAKYYQYILGRYFEEFDNVGLYICPGETLATSRQLEWFRDVIFRAAKASGKNPLLIIRDWTLNMNFREQISSLYENCYSELKHNDETVTSPISPGLQNLTATRFGNFWATVMLQNQGVDQILNARKKIDDIPITLKREAGRTKQIYYSQPVDTYFFQRYKHRYGVPDLIERLSMPVARVDRLWFRPCTLALLHTGTVRRARISPFLEKSYRWAAVKLALFGATGSSPVPAVATSVARSAFARPRRLGARDWLCCPSQILIFGPQTGKLALFGAAESCLADGPDRNWVCLARRGRRLAPVQSRRTSGPSNGSRGRGLAWP